MLTPYDLGMVRDVLTGLQMRQEQVDAIVETLSSRASALDSADPAAVQQAWFGGSSTGSHRLGTNTTMARDAVVEEFGRMVQGLQGYREAVRTFAAGMTSAEDTSVATMANIDRAVSYTQAPEFNGGRGTPPTQEG